MNTVLTTFFVVAKCCKVGNNENEVLATRCEMVLCFYELWYGGRTGEWWIIL